MSESHSIRERLVIQQGKKEIVGIMAMTHHGSFADPPVSYDANDFLFEPLSSHDLALEPGALLQFLSSYCAYASPARTCLCAPNSPTPIQ